MEFLQKYKYYILALAIGVFLYWQYKKSSQAISPKSATKYKAGDTGPGVEDLQKALNVAGDKLGGGQIDVTGKVDAATLMFLEMCGYPSGASIQEILDFIKIIP